MIVGSSKLSKSVLEMVLRGTCMLPHRLTLFYLSLFLSPRTQSVNEEQIGLCACAPHNSKTYPNYV